MKSSNPHSGVYEADTSRTLDNNGGNPACNQGGMAVVYDASRRHNYEPFENVSETVQAAYGTGGGNIPIVLEGNGSRESHKGDGYKQSDIMYTLNTIEQHAVCCLNDQGVSVMSTSENITSTLRAQEHGHQPIVYDARGNGNGELAPTITGDHQNRVTDYTALCIGNGQMCNMSMKPIANSLDTMHDQQAVITAVDLFSAKESDINGTLQARCSNNLNSNNVCRVKNVVRRLTPLEVERLQGFPDNYTNIGDWTDTKGKKHKAADSPRYKALGNSIAIPCWQFILQGISDRCREHTMASLFAGIGGFELCSLQVGIKPIWNSEVEEYCSAVTKKHFGNGDEKGDYEQYL
jgi:DNA (cytosine-5)-methyltransferase 1